MKNVFANIWASLKAFRKHSSRCANCGKIHGKAHSHIPSYYEYDEWFCSVQCSKQYVILKDPLRTHSGFRHPIESDLLIKALYPDQYKEHFLEKPRPNDGLSKKNECWGEESLCLGCDGSCKPKPETTSPAEPCWDEEARSYMCDGDCPLSHTQAHRQANYYGPKK